MKKRVITLFLALVMCLTLLPAVAAVTAPVTAPVTEATTEESPFPDVDEYAPYVDAAEYVKKQGIMVGDKYGKFNPDQTVTRAEMATIVCRVLGQTENLPVSNTFTDVPVSHWANKYIAKAAELQIVGGYGNGKFGPGDMVTYEQAVTMVIRALGGSEFAVDAGGYPDGFISVAQTYGLLNDVQAEIGEPLSRASIALILYNCYGFDFYDCDN